MRCSKVGGPGSEREVKREHSRERGRMYKSLPDVIAEILSYHGAIVDKAGDDCLDAVVPPEITAVLGVPEYTRLGFSYGSACGSAVPATYDSEFFSSVNKLFAGRVRVASARLDAALPNVGKTARLIGKRVVFQNAVFRMDKVEITGVSYLLVLLKFAALSDEKHEGIVPVLVNGMNSATMTVEGGMRDLTANLFEPYAEGGDTERPPQKSDLPEEAFRSACIAGAHIVQERQGEFIRSLERRLNRDVKRVFEYYQALRDEIERKIGRRNGGVTGSLADKLNVIDMERQGKIQDLITKYALNIRIEPIAAVTIDTRAPVFRITVKRRLAERGFPLTYNPLSGGLDPLPCESCFHPRGGYFVCGDRLHIVCGRCFAACLSCGRPYCRACHQETCPKCKRKNRHEIRSL